MAASGPPIVLAKAPNHELAGLNRLLVSEDLALPSGCRHVTIKPRDGAPVVFTIHKCKEMRANQAGVNIAQRTWGNLSLGEEVVPEPVMGTMEGVGKLKVSVSLWKEAGAKPTRYKTDEIAAAFRQEMANTLVSIGQLLLFRYRPAKGSPVNLKLSVEVMSPLDLQGASQSVINRGVVTSHTLVEFVPVPDSAVMVDGHAAKKNIIAPDWKFEDMGIGGLDEQFATMFRLAFASRMLPVDAVDRLGIQHVKGILLSGPPGTGKTLIARKIGQMLNGREPKIVNGPEVLSKFVGEAERNIRELFADAEQEYKAKGDDSETHIIIFDEIDAICKTRGSVNNGTGVNDSMVNQLLSKIDGVDALNNILLIGMTNRPDMIDEALVRPGRLELKLEIGLPDQDGRKQIFVIHTQKMKENGALGADVDMEELAEMTKNFSGAEIAGVCRAAASYAFNRCIKFDNTVEVKEEELASIQVMRADFMLGLEDVTPAFGTSTDDLEVCTRNGIIHWDPCVKRILADGELFLKQVELSSRTPLVSVLLSGDAGSGKTALAATLAASCSFPFIKLISPEQMVGRSEAMKVQQISKVFEDAYKSKLSCIVIDDLERLIEYVPVGPRFSNTILQALLVLLKKGPPEGHKLMLFSTTSNKRALAELGLLDGFASTLHVDNLSTGEQIQTILDALQPFPEKDMEYVKVALSHGSTLTIEALSDSVQINIPVKKLYLLIEMAAQDKATVGETFLHSVYRACDTFP
eukprot:m.171310 g.171310  ORF g.171310 m.171310 type:complete len:748 (+) comp14549_c0_seq11:6039-8282(+)